MKISKKLYPLLVLSLVSMWPLYLFIFTGRAIFEGTSLNHLPPLRSNAVQTMLEGHLPLWNPHVFMGMPSLADGVTGPFDILNIVYLIFDPLWAIIMLTVLQIFFAGLFMYLYLRKSLQLETISALLGGVLYTLNPALLYATGCGLDHLAPNGSILWLPLIMLFLDKSIEEKTHFISYAMLAGIGLCLAFFGGNANLVLFIVCFISIYLLGSPISLGRNVTILFIIGMSSFLISLVQLLPTLHTVNISNRSVLWPIVDHDETGLNLLSFIFSIFEFQANRFLNIFRISHLEQFIDNYRSWYIGFFNFVLLCLIYFIKADDHKIRFNKIFIPLLVGIHICMFYLPLRGWITTILPGVNGIRIGHSMFLLYFSAIILIAKIFDNLASGGCKEQKIKEVVIWAKQIIIPVLAILTMAPLGAVLYKLVSSRTLMPIDVRYWIIVIVCYFLLGSSFYVLAKIIKTKGGVSRRLKFLLFLLIISNLALEWGYSYGRTSKTTLKAHFKDSVEVEFLKNMQPAERMAVLYKGKSRDALEYSREQYFGFNLPLFYNVNIMAGSHQMHSGRAKIFLDMLNGRYPFDSGYYWKDGKNIRATASACLEDEDANFNLINLSGVKYFFSPDPLLGAGEKNHLITEGGSYFIYENLNSYPRAFIVYNYDVLDEEEILDKLNDNDFSPLKTLLMEKEPIVPGLQLNIPLSEKYYAKIKSYMPNEVVIEVETQENGFLVLTDAYDKDWKAYIDEKNTEIYRADYLFRAVFMPRGKHQVKFKYMPMSFVYGAYLSIISLVLGLAYILFDFIKFPRKNS